MKILHIGKYYPPYFGGIEKVNFDLVESLNYLGFSTDVLCFNDEKKSTIENNNYTIFRTSTLSSAYSSPISLSIFWKLKKIHRNYDIIHLHLPNPMGAIALQFVNFKGKIIIHWHSDIIKQKKLKLFYAPFQKNLLKRADKIIVTTPNYLEGSKDLQPYKEKCTIISIGISNSEFIHDNNFQQKLNNQYKNKKVIFSLGRLIYYKGFEYLVEAAKKLPEDYLVLIAGTGTLENKLEEQINKNKLQKKVVLLGKIPFEHIGEYYKKADVFCLPSIERSEAFGVVLIEAMSFGCPVVSTNIKGSGVSWVNRNNETGLVVPPKNADALSKAIIKIGETTELHKKFSENALKRYNEFFTKEKMVEKTIELYQNIMK